MTQQQTSQAKSERRSQLEAKLGRAAKLYLDASASKLSPNVSRRLQEARRAALVAMNSRTAAHNVAVGGGTLARTGNEQANTPLLWGASLLAALALAVYAGMQWDQNVRAHEAAEADLEILASDVPMDAYFDKGFKSYLSQNR
jgi:hypothetical protein